MKVFFATSNLGKLREAQAICAATSLELVTRDYWLGDAETGTTYRENAIAKAQAAVKLAGMAVLAEDAGIEIDAFGGMPGLHSARFAGPNARDSDNNVKLVEWLTGLGLESSKARYRAVAALAFPSGQVVTGAGVMEGRVTVAASGTGGFGYDPHFVPEGLTVTAAELSAEEKNAISHRRKALEALLEAGGF